MNSPRQPAWDNMRGVEQGDKIVVDPRMSTQDQVQIMSMSRDSHMYDPSSLRSVVTSTFSKYKLYTVSRVTSDYGELKVKIYGKDGTYPVKYFMIASKSRGRSGNANHSARAQMEARRRLDEKRTCRIEEEQAILQIKRKLEEQRRCIIKASCLPSETTINGKKIKLDEDDQGDVLELKQLVKLEL